MSTTMPFDSFCAYAEQLEDTSGNEKTHVLADCLSEAGDDVGIAARFAKGDIFPAWDDRKVSVGPSLMYRGIAAASGQTKEDIEEMVADVGDPGEVCESLDMSPDTGQVTLGGVSTDLTLSRVYETFEDIAETSGSGSTQAKVDAIKNLLFDASAREGKYITRLLLGKMRIGIGDGTVRDAIAEAFDQPVAIVERGIMVTNDVEQVATTARDGGTAALEELEIVLGRPVKPMLAQKSTKTDCIGDAGVDGEVAVEWKFDGARLQIHVDGDEVRLFTRRMNEVTDSMPDVCDIVRDHVETNEAILDCEVVAYEPGATEPSPFQEVMKRLRRKHDVEEKAEDIHLDIHTFDILYASGETLIDASLRERRDRLRSVVSEDVLADRWIVDSPEEVGDIEEDALAAGNEGVMVKNPESSYQPDNRGKNWLKIKPDVETLDCVVVGGEWGEGRRAEWVGTYMLAVRDEETGDLKKVGKVATGITDSELADLTERFEPLIISEDGTDIKFEPEIVFEVGCEEIQPSPTYDSGYGLRFPRLVTVREDKGVDDADTVERVERLYENQ